MATQARCIINALPRTILFSVIPLDGGPHVGTVLKLWKGDSRGHRKGNTLVVDVTNDNGKERLDMVGDFDSPAVHFVELFHFFGCEYV